MIVASKSVKIEYRDYETYFGTQPQATEDQTLWEAFHIGPCHTSNQAGSSRSQTKQEPFYSESPSEPPTISPSQSESSPGTEMVSARARNTTHLMARCPDPRCRSVVFYGADCENSLQRHNRKEHRGILFSCPRCTKVNPRRYVIIEHMVDKHGMEKVDAESLVPKSQHRESRVKSSTKESVGL
jgi:phage FluMu protein Com